MGQGEGGRAVGCGLRWGIRGLDGRRKSAKIGENRGKIVDGKTSTMSIFPAQSLACSVYGSSCWARQMQNARLLLCNLVHGQVTGPGEMDETIEARFYQVKTSVDR